MTLSQDAFTLTLANHEVSLVFDKGHGSLKSLVYGGRELLAGGGYVQVASTSRDDPFPTKWEPHVIREERALVEIAFVNVDPRCPLDLAAHYILRADESGFHNYLVFGHDAARSPGVHTLAQYNFALRIDPTLFTTAAVDDQRIRPFPRADLLTPDRLVMDSTYLLPGGGYYSKYFYTAEMDERHTVHGAMGDHVGIWIVMPSHEHLNGGPEHQELTVHEAGASQVLLAHATAAHYGAGLVVSDSRDGSWSKVSAPWFVYVNSGPDQAAMWRDAKARAARAVAEWPYAWLDPALFQLKRGAVAGRLTLDRQKPAPGARLVLAEHEENPPPLAWQQQWRGYRFYGWADADGRFDLDKVRPGSYDLYAYQPGRFGQFVHRGVRVEPGATTALGDLDWRQPAGRRTLWQIGTPDRSAAEFGFAEDFRRWGLWREIADATPDGVTYVVGKSGARDWPFEMAVTQNKDLSWHVPAWRVQFEVPAAPGAAAKAFLTLGIAAYEGKQNPQLNVSLNGRPVGCVADLEVSGAAHRSGIHAGYQERQITFDAALLKPCANTLLIEMPSPGKAADRAENAPRAALLWDCLRLEIAEPLVVDVLSSGADPTGRSPCTAAVQKAIDRCAEAGGGTVVLSKGRFLSGTLFMKSGVTLHIDEEATLLGSTSGADYPDARPAHVRSFNDGRSQKQLIYGEDLHDVAITGKGTIDGQGGSFPMAPRGATPDRPFVIRLVACRNVLVEGLNLHASAFWMQHYLECDDLTVRNVRVVNHANWNNDAIDIDGCHGVRVEGLTADSSDDGITLKSTTLRACEDVTVTKCLIRTHAVGIKFGTESIGGFKRVRISDCDIKRSEFRKGDFGGRPDGKGGIGLMSLDGADVDDVEISRVRIEGTMSPIFLRLHDRGRPAEPGKQKPIGSIRNVTLSDVTATDAGPTGSLVSGVSGHPIENLTLRNVHVTTVGGVAAADVRPPADELARGSGAGPGMYGLEPAYGILFYCVNGLVLDNVNVEAAKPDERPGLAFVNVTGLKVDGRPVSAQSAPPPPGTAFLDRYLAPANSPAEPSVKPPAKPSKTSPAAGQE